MDIPLCQFQSVLGVAIAYWGLPFDPTESYVDTFQSLSDLLTGRMGKNEGRRYKCRMTTGESFFCILSVLIDMGMGSSYSSEFDIHLENSDLQGLYSSTTEFAHSLINSYESRKLGW
jgi:hypothetical protein